jgi:hypothetical protein
VNAINGKNKTLALFSVITIAAIVSGILLAPQMVNATETNSTDLTTQTSTTTTNDETNTTVLPNWNPYCTDLGRYNMRRETRGFGGFGPIKVSEDFKQTVTTIAENDTDVQNLINDGYNVTAVNPIISTVIDGEGNVVTKATSAVLILQKDTTGHATVMVNIEQAKVTQIVIARANPNSYRQTLTHTSALSPLIP